MKIARTAADAAVDAPKKSRNSRSQVVWQTRAQSPEPKRHRAREGDPGLPRLRS
jgi:hypothetical protein